MHDYADYHQISIDLAPAEPSKLSWRVDIYKKKWGTMFLRLHQNEETLNEKFIHIYGLEDELTPDVPLDEVTILQQGEISIEKKKRRMAARTMRRLSGTMMSSSSSSSAIWWVALWDAIP